MSLSTVATSSHPAGAASLSQDRARADALLTQINNINAQVGRLGQKYDLAEIKLQKYSNDIKNTKKMVAEIKSNVSKGDAQLRKDVIFAYVTNGSISGNNPLFSKNAANVGATSVYTQLAEGNINSKIASLKNYRIELTQERSVLNAEDANARAATLVAAKAYNKSRALQASLNRALGQVKGQIAVYVNEAEAAAARKSAGELQHPGASLIPAPPPDSRANIAIRAAESYRGVPYVWGGASRRGVDCSGLIMLAYDAAGIYLPHYSGSQYEDTVRVPLIDIEPGDLLFYGYDGDQHVAMYIGHGYMIEAEETGTVVHEVPIRLGYGFFGLGRPRA